MNPSTDAMVSAQQFPWNPLLPDFGDIGWVESVVLASLFFIGSVYIYLTRVAPAGREGKWARHNAVVPPGLQGAWAFSLFDCCSDCGSCLRGWLCFPCTISETCFKAGWTQALCSSFGCNVDAFGSYWGGMCIFMSILTGCTLNGVVVPLFCCFAATRGGSNKNLCADRGMVTMEKRFDISNMSLLQSCLVWCFCPICAACQENKQIMALIEHPDAVLNPGAMEMGQAQMLSQEQAGMPGQQAMVQP